MSTFNMQNLSLLLIFSMACLCWTRPSHALGVRQKLIELGTSVDLIKDTMNASSIDLHEKLNEITEAMNVKVRQLTEAMNVKVRQLTEAVNVKAMQLTEAANAKMMQITEKMDRITGTLDDVITATGCQTNFTLFESSCYYFGEALSTHEGDHSYAKAQCETKGSDLVAIESKKEAHFIFNHIVSGHHYWTSAHKHGAVWMWDSTGENIADFYDPWQTGEPNTATHFCAFVHYTNGKLYDYQCSQTGWRYICETKLPACAWT